jgi:two-component system, OmpR family, sensor histidine kinase VicK
MIKMSLGSLIRWSSNLNDQAERRTRELNESNKHLEEANEQLKAHDKMQKEFINVASHELKTPTQAILAFASLIGRHPEKRDEMMQAICRNAVRLQRLTDHILDVTRIESHTLKLNKEQFDLSDLVYNIVEDYRHQLEKDTANAKVLLVYDCDKADNNDDDNYKSHIFIEADRERIGQVISNLLSNAIKFTIEGSIFINVMEKRKEKGYNNQEVIVSVKDTGAGIDPEILPRLFTKFATKSETGGTGLGLFISKSIVESHGGRMWAANNNGEYSEVVPRQTRPWQNILLWSRPRVHQESNHIHQSNHHRP